MDKYNKSVQHQWFHHATWGDSKYKNEGIGEVLWHSLTESGKVERVNIKFGKNVYENVSVNHLKPLKIEAHGHAPEEEKPVGKKKKKTEGNLKLESMVGKMMSEAQFDEAAGKKDACYH